MRYALADYIADHYGACYLLSCVCNRPENPWLGRGCQNWRPVAATNWEEMIDLAKSIYQKKDQTP